MTDEMTDETAAGGTINETGNGTRDETTSGEQDGTAHEAARNDG